MMKERMLFAMLLACGLCSQQLHCAEREFRAGFSALFFDYEEFDAQGDSLNTEEGVIPGLYLALEQRDGPWLVDADLQLHQGEVDHDEPAASTRTRERLIDAGARVGYRLAGSEHTPVYAYAGAGYRDWRRDIRSTSDLSGLLEEYAWWYLCLGVRAEGALDARNRLVLDLRLLRPVDPDLDVRFRDRPYDDIEVEPGSRTGLRSALWWHRTTGPASRLWLTAWLEYQPLDASPRVAVLQDGAPLDPPKVAHEPDSKTVNTGIMLGLSWRI